VVPSGLYVKEPRKSSEDQVGQEQTKAVPSGLVVKEPHNQHEALPLKDQMVSARKKAALAGLSEEAHHSHFEFHWEVAFALDQDGASAH